MNVIITLFIISIIINIVLWIVSYNLSDEIKRTKNTATKNTASKDIATAFLLTFGMSINPDLADEILQNIQGNAYFRESETLDMIRESYSACIGLGNQMNNRPPDISTIAATIRPPVINDMDGMNVR